MATKPVVQPELWASDAVYTTGPFPGSILKVVPGAAIAAEGHRPGALFPTAAEHENSQQNRLTALARWLFLGTFNTTADAHVVETNAQGRAGVHGLTVADLIDETAVVITSAATVVPAVLATALTGTTVYQAEVGNSAGTGFAAITKLGAATGFAAFMQGSPAGATGISISADAATAGRALAVDHAGSGDPVVVTSSGIPANNVVLKVTSTGPATTVGISGTGSLNGAGVAGRGNAVAGNGVEGTVMNPNNFGVWGRSANAGSTLGRGVAGYATGDSDGVEGRASGNGNAVRAVATSASNVAIYVPGKATDPSSTFNGRLDFNTTTATFVHSDQDAANYRDFYSARGGLVVGAGTPAGQVVTNNSAVAYLTAVTLTLTGQDAPKRTGTRFLLRFTCTARTIGVLNTLDLQLYDVTAGAPLSTRAGVGSAATNGYELAATANWQGPVVFDYVFTVGTVGDRTFRVDFKTATANPVTVRDPMLVPYGAFA